MDTTTTPTAPAVSASPRWPAPLPWGSAPSGSAARPRRPAARRRSRDADLQHRRAQRVRVLRRLPGRRAALRAPWC